MEDYRKILEDRSFDDLMRMCFSSDDAVEACGDDFWRTLIKRDYGMDLDQTAHPLAVYTWYQSGCDARIRAILNGLAPREVPIFAYYYATGKLNAAALEVLQYLLEGKFLRVELPQAKAILGRNKLVLVRGDKIFTAPIGLLALLKLLVGLRYFRGLGKLSIKDKGSI